MILRALKAVLLVKWVLLCFLAGWVVLKLKKPALRDRIARACYRGMLRIIGVHVAVSGEMAPARPLLVVSNHVSYLDVPVLGSVFPFRFTPKLEISRWPGIASLCAATGALYIDRKPSAIGKNMEKLRAALAGGEVVSVFPEATTSAGVRMLPFKTSFFDLAEGGVWVQPVAIAYSRIRRLPIDSGQWPLIAWYGDMDLVPHLWTLLGLGRIDVRVTFLPPETIGAHGGDRKRLAARCEQVISEVIQANR